MDLERDDDACALRGIGQLRDVAEERGLVLVGALVPADGGVDDRQPVLGGPEDGSDAVVEPLSSRQVGVPAEAHGLEPMTFEDAAHLGRRRAQVDVLGPARDGRELDVPVAGRGDALERLLEAVRVVRVRMAGEWVHAVLSSRRSSSGCS